MHEIRFVFRRIGRSPRLWLLSVLTLSLAIGGSGALLSLFNTFVLRQLALPEPFRLVTVYAGIGEALLGVPLRTLVELRSRQQVVDDLCGYSRGALQVEVGGLVSSRTNEGLTGGCYRMLGVKAQLGRLFDETDAPDVGDSALVTVVSHRFWTQEFGGDPAIIGRTVRVQGATLTIVGVTPPDFDGIDVDRAPDLTVPLALMAQLMGAAPGNVFALQTIGRLRQDTTLTTARTQLRQLWPDVWAATNPTPAGRPASPAAAAENLRVESIARGLSEQRTLYRTTLPRLLTLSAFLLLLACLNVGGVLLARTMARDREFAVLAALGATRARLGRLLAGEGVALGTLAALVAVTIAWWVSRELAATVWIRLTPNTMDVSPEPWVLMTIAVVAFAAGILVYAPASMVVFRRQWQGSSGLRVSDRVTVAQRVLIVGQVAVSLVLVFCAGLFVRNLATIRNLDPGYEPDTLRWTRLTLAFGQPREVDQAAYIRPPLDRIRGYPGVTGIALASSFPSTELRHVSALTPIRRVDDAPGTAGVPGFIDWVSPGFFSTLGIRLLQGDEFAWASPASEMPAIVNRALAARLFPNGDAIAARLQYVAAARPVNVTVIGVTENSSPGDVRIRDLPMMYLPIVREPRLMSGPVVVIRTNDDAGLDKAVRSAVEPLGRHRVPRLQTIVDQANRLQMRERLLAGLATAFAGLSLLIGSLGLYALLSQLVAGRTRELGVRRALGASALRILAIVLGEGTVLVMLGLALGLPAVFIAGRAVRALLYNVSSSDPLALSVSVFLLAGIGLVSSACPAARAVRVDPAEALRHE